MSPCRLSGFITIVIFSFSVAVKAQTGNGSFMLFDQFFRNYSMINPASSDTSGKFAVNIGHTWLSGLFEGVNRMYADADYRPGKMENNSFSRLGILVMSSNDGAFINRSRYYGRYSRAIAIGKGQYISLGAALGFVRYRLKGSYTFPGGSSTAFDGNAGIWYLGKNLKAGISVQQFSGSVLTPIQQSFKLSPVWNLNLVYTALLSRDVRFTNHFYFRKEISHPGWFDYAPVFLFSETLEAGANFKVRRGISVLLGVRTSTKGFGDLRLMGSFLISTRQLSNSADNKFEISMGYSL